jgi:K+-sensing histidine kinase KdpD
MTTIYRNYVVARVGDKFVAKSQDDECLLVSSQQQRLHAAIDDLWDSLEKGTEPAWFSGSSAIDIDTFGPESVPSSGDPPAERAPPGMHKISYLAFGVTAILVAGPLSFLMECYFPKRVDTMLTVGVCAVAVAFGRNYALLVTAIAGIMYNFFVADPILGFSIPTASEAVFWFLDLVAATAMPELLKLRCLQGRLGKDRTRRT